LRADTTACFADARSSPAALDRIVVRSETAADASGARGEDRTLYVADRDNHKIKKLPPLMPGLSTSEQLIHRSGRRGARVRRAWEGPRHPARARGCVGVLRMGWRTS
jgi:hypothetical protein